MSLRRTKSSESKMSFIEAPYAGRRMIGASLIGLAALGLVGCGNDKSTEEIVYDHIKDRVDTSQEATPTEAPTNSPSPEAYAQRDIQERVNDYSDYVYEYFDNMVQMVQNSINSNLEGGNPTKLDTEARDLFQPPDLNKPRSEWTDQDYLNYLTIMTAMATSDSELDVSRQFASVVAEPNTNIYSNVMSEIEDADHYHLAVYKNLVRTSSGYSVSADGRSVSSKEILNDTVRGVKVGEDGGRLVTAAELGVTGSSDYAYAVLFVNHKDSKGRIVTTVALDINTHSAPNEVANAYADAQS